MKKILKNGTKIRWIKQGNSLGWPYPIPIGTEGTIQDYFEANDVYGIWVDVQSLNPQLKVTRWKSKLVAAHSSQIEEIKDV